MSVPSAYLMSTKNTAAILDAMQRAAVPETFSYEFLKQLGFASSGDRPTIPVLKAITFLDQSGSPTALYRKYKDKALAGGALAEGLRFAYSDVFAVDTEANTKSVSQLSGIFGRLSDKGESVTSKMATTFKFLCALADFGFATADVSTDRAETELEHSTEQTAQEHFATVGLSMRHDIHIHLPVSTDVAVYDAIFRSIKANLL